MNAISKLAAFAFLAASAALMTASSQAQSPRQVGYPIDPRPTPAPKCCALAVRTFGTNNVTWSVQVGSSTPVPATAVSTTPYWAPAFAGSQWIASSAAAGTYPGVAPGQYVYTYHFCLCELPGGGNAAPPATLALKVLSDNQFIAYLNGNQIGQNLSTTTSTFTYPTLIPSVPPGYFQQGDNELKFVVTNDGYGPSNNGSQIGRIAASSAPAPQAQTVGPNPSGLDVTGTLAAYFLDLPRDVRCPRIPRNPPSPVR